MRHGLALWVALAIGCGASPPPSRHGVPTAAPRSLAVGSHHACALDADGAVLCWGGNSFGDLGDGTTQPRAVPGPVAGLPPMVEVAASCARTEAGAVWCWGGELEEPPAPAPLPMPVATTQLAVSYGPSCALGEDRRVYCWGTGYHGALGDGGTADRERPGRALVEDAVEVSVGSYFGCVRVGDGSVRCWGLNDHGQLGDGTIVDRPRPIEVHDVDDARLVRSGLQYSCAVTGDGLHCWGALDADVRAPARVASGDFVDVAIGYAHACAARADGRVICWGDNDRGQLGDGTSRPSATAVTVIGLDGVVELGAGRAHTCARRRDRSIHCWGDGTSLQLGDGESPVATPRPVAVPGLRDAVAITAGTTGSCARRRDGSVVCWGELDVRTGIAGERRLVDHAPAPLLDLAGATSVDAGDRALCAIRPDGSVLCAGLFIDRSDFCALGGGPAYVDFRAGTALPAAAPAVALDAGLHHACAVREDGSVRCFGVNVNGVLGPDHDAAVREPVAIPGLPPVEEVVVGHYHTCARDRGGAVLCWGQSVDGQLGDGTTEWLRSEPRRVEGLGVARDLDAGGLHTCALLAGGTVACWGDNRFGQLGDGSTEDRAAPVAVPALASVTALALGDAHGCALVENGEVRCWGRNASGELGDGTTTDRSLPVAVAGLAGVVQIAAGAAHTCALLRDGTARCWGHHGEGQLGNGRASYRPRPAPVALPSP